MKKLTLIAVLFLILGLAFTFGADVDKISVSGSVGMTFGDSVLGDGLGPVFSASKSGTFANISVGTANDKVQAGVTVSLVPAIAVDYHGKDADTSYVWLGGIVDMITWYFNAAQGVTYMDDDGVEQTLPAIDFNALEDAIEAQTGLDFVIFGNPTAGWTVVNEDDVTEWVAESGIAQDHIKLLANAVYGAIETAIKSISAVYTAGTGANTISIGGLTGISPFWTDEQQAAAWKEAAMWSDFEKYTGIDAVANADKYTASASTPVTGAFLKLNAVAGVVDITFEVNGKAVAIGNMVTSQYTAGGANLGLSFDLAGGVVPGLSAGLLLSNSSDTADATGDDSLTYNDDSYVLADEAYSALAKNVYGMQLNVGYTYASDAMSAGAMVKFGVKDFAAFGSSLLIGIEPSFSMPGVAGLNVGAEFNLVPKGNDDAFGVGIGATVGASIMGISPSVYFKMKTAAFGGNDSYGWFGSDDVDDSGAAAHFASIDDTAATGLGVGVSVDLAELIGMSLVTLNANWDMLMNEGVTYMGFGAGLGLNFAEVLGQPLSLGFTIGKYAANDLAWEASLGYTYAEIFGVTGAFGNDGTDTYWSIGGSVSF